MKKIFLIMILVTSFILSADDLTHAIGMSAGYISGSGISYRQMNQKSGYQIAGGAYYNYEPEDEEDEFNYDIEENKYLGWNISGTYYYILKNWQTSRFYLLAGTTIFDVYDITQNKFGDFEEENEDKTYINVGIGIGLEFPLTKYLHLSVEWPWYYDGKSEFLKFIPQAGVHYYFK